MAALASIVLSTLALTFAQPADVRIAVIGDSTSDETTEWAYLLGDSLRRRFGERMVYRNYDKTARVWTKPIVRGSGAHTVTIDNASCGGWSAGMFAREISWLGLKHLLPERPDLILVSLGHNDRVSWHRAQLNTLLDKLGDIPVALVTQNPQHPLFGSEPAQRARMDITRQIAAERGLALVDVEAAFDWRIRLGDWSWYDPGEWLHPNSVGQWFWEAAVERALAPPQFRARATYYLLCDPAHPPW